MSESNSRQESYEAHNGQMTSIMIVVVIFFLLFIIHSFIDSFIHSLHGFT